MKNIIYSSKYQNLHLDRAKKNSMTTVNVEINSALASNQSYLLYEYSLDIDYIPQFWGLWDVYFPPAYEAAGGFSGTRRGYGKLSNNTGAQFIADFYYIVYKGTVSLYLNLADFFGTAPDPTGTKITFTGYLFSNGIEPQDYT